MYLLHSSSFWASVLLERFSVSDCWGFTRSSTAVWRWAEIWWRRTLLCSHRRSVAIAATRSAPETCCKHGPKSMLAGLVSVCWVSRRLVIDMKRGKRVSILGVLLSVKLDGLSSASLMVMEPVVPRLKCCDLMQFAPPRNAMRQIHAHRQEERKQREQEKEAEEFENEMSMNLAGKMLIVNTRQWVLTGSWIQVQFVKDLCFRIGSCTATRYYLICQGAVALTWYCKIL